MRKTHHLSIIFLQNPLGFFTLGTVEKNMQKRIEASTSRSLTVDVKELPKQLNKNHQKNVPLVICNISIYIYIYNL